MGCPVSKLRLLVLITLLLVVPVASFADNPDLADLQADTSTAKTQVVIQYVPGTQVNCSGLFGLLDCLVNDILRVGGTL